MVAPLDGRVPRERTWIDPHNHPEFETGAAILILEMTKWRLARAAPGARTRAACATSASLSAPLPARTGARAAGQVLCHREGAHAFSGDTQQEKQLAQ